jgi:two-component system response regulator AtoC
MALVAVVEDHVLQRRTLGRTLRSVGYQTVECGSGAEALETCRSHLPEAVLLDLGLPDSDGLDLLPDLLAVSPLSRIVVLTGHDSVREAVAALRGGARHYLVKPWDRDELLLVLKREIAAVNRTEVTTRRRASSVFWGTHAGMRQIRADVERLASSPATPVLILGETGTGKEVIARELHEHTRPGGQLVALNCAAIPSDLMESELFGHERGAFTGAEARRRGVVELADGGTLLLDEVAEMSLHLQAKLLRFLQDGRFRAVGAETEQRSTCRVVAATHADLESLQGGERFRQDLYYRLSVVTLRVPALRDRSEDLLGLASFLMERICQRLGRRPRPLSAAAERAVMAHPWPGNVRELANRIERALVLGSGPQIEPGDLDLAGRPGSGPASAETVLADAAKLRHLLEQEGGNVSAVARRLALPRHKVKYRVGKLGLR